MSGSVALCVLMHGQTKIKFALIIIYSLNTILLYMFRASSAHLQEDTAYGTVTLYESSWWPVGTQLE